MKFKTTYITTIFFLFGFSDILSQPDKNQTIIMELDKHNAVTLVKNDTTSLKKYLSKDFLINGSNNKISTGDHWIISAIKNGRIHYTQFDVVTDTVYFINKKTAVSMGTETVMSGSEGPLKNVLQKRRYTNIWINEKTGWKLKSRHSSIICSN